MHLVGGINEEASCWFSVNFDTEFSEESKIDKFL